MIKKGTWIEITKVVLTPEERSNNIPQDTKNTPLRMWVKGFCKENCDLGEIVKIETLTGRLDRGTVVQVEPNYTHSFGNYIKEIAFIGKQARKILFSDNR